MRKHRLAERHLADDIGLDVALVHEEACRWEHVMSIEVEKRLAAKIRPPYVDPYGNPIPGLDALGITVAADHAVATGEGSDETATTLVGKGSSKPFLSLAEVAADGSPVSVRVERICERVQADADLLAEFARHGLMPGGIAVVRRAGEHVVLERDGEQLIVAPDDLAGQIAVTVDTGE